MTALFRGVFATTRTKRRRVLWCAWWTGEPTADPFRPPDAWAGGARTEDEAKSLAEAAAGLPLVPIAGRWAGAWVRVREGLPPFVERGPGRLAPRPGAPPVNPYAVLGVENDAPLEAIKAAFRQKALQHHPDHGGEPAAFIALKRAYDTVCVRRRRHPGRPR